MSNYTQTTFFAPKDALLSGNPAKIIKGADVDPELAAIAVAIATKYDPTNLFSIVPTWTGLHTFNAGITVAAGSVVVGAPTGGGQGTGTINATGLFINGVAVTAGANLLVSNNSWSGINLFAGPEAASVAATGVNLGLDGGQPSVQWINASAAANQKVWEMYGDASGSLIGRTLNDAFSAADEWVHVTRTALAIASIVFGNSADKPPITLNGPVSIPSPASGNPLSITDSTNTVTTGGGLFVQSQNAAVATVYGWDHVNSNSGTFSFESGGVQHMTMNLAGNIIINAPSSGVALSVVGSNTAAAGLLFSSSVAGNVSSPDIQINRLGGTANQIQQGASLALFDATNTTISNWQQSGGQTELWQFNGSWQQILRVTTGLAIQGRGPVAAGMVDMTPDASTFTGTLTGFTAGVTGTCVWSRNGNQVMLFIPILSGTSNATTMTLTGIPSAIQPARAQRDLTVILDNGNNAVGMYSISGGTITFSINVTGTAFTATGTKGFPFGTTIKYLLN